MPFSEKHAVVLSILTACLLVMLIAYAGSLPSAGAHAHRAPAEKPAGPVYEEPSEYTAHSSADDAEGSRMHVRDAGLPAVRAPSIESDDLITTLLRQCVDTRSCPAWARATMHSADGGHR